MNRAIAYRLLQAELDAYRKLPHQELAFLVGESTSVVRYGDDATEYSIDISVRWLADPDGEVVINASVGAADWGSHHDRLDELIVLSGRRDTESGL